MTEKLQAVLSSKTVWAGIGLIGLAVYQATQGQYDLALQTFFGAVAALGLRHAISKDKSP